MLCFTTQASKKQQQIKTKAQKCRERNFGDEDDILYFAILRRGADDYFLLAQTMSISMYFAVSWIEPRLRINESAPEWFEDRTGPQDVSIFII